MHRFKTGDLVEVNCTPFDVPVSTVETGVVVQVHGAIGYSESPAYEVLVLGERRMYRASHLQPLRPKTR